jgi:rhomboid protease GluP
MAATNRPIATLCVLGVTSLFTALNIAGVPVVSLLGRTPGSLGRGEWWRLVTPVFVNRGGWLEIVVNLAAPAALGVLVERWYGSRRWLVIYVVSGVVGELAGYAWKPFGAGSSVSVMGLAGAVAAWLVLRKRTISTLALGAVLLVVGLALTALRNLHGPPLLAGLSLGAAAIGRSGRTPSQTTV